jgi:hypothetical protein
MLLEVNTGIAARSLFGAKALDSVDGDVSRYICVEAKRFTAIEEGKNSGGFSVSGRQLVEVGSLGIVTSNGVPIGTLYRVVYSVADGAGNTASMGQSVQVVDTTAPDVRLKGGSWAHVPFGTEFREPGIDVTDNSGENITAVFPLDAVVDVYTSGSVTLKYNASDGNGNVGRVERGVFVSTNARPSYEFVARMILQSVQNINPRAAERDIRQARNSSDFVIVFGVSSSAPGRRDIDSGNVIEFGVRRHSDFELLPATDIVSSTPASSLTTLNVASISVAPPPSTGSNTTNLLPIIGGGIGGGLMLGILLWMLCCRRRSASVGMQNDTGHPDKPAPAMSAAFMESDLDSMGPGAGFSASNLYAVPTLRDRRPAVADRHVRGTSSSWEVPAVKTLQHYDSVEMALGPSNSTA